MVVCTFSIPCSYLALTPFPLLLSKRPQITNVSEVEWEELAYTVGGNVNWYSHYEKQYQFSSVTQSCPILCDPMDCSTPGFPVHHQLPELTQMSIVSVRPSNHLILCHPLVLLPSIFPRIRVFSGESVLPIRWPKYWNFSFSSINPCNEYSGLISFRMDWLDLLAVQRTLKSFI